MPQIVNIELDLATGVITSAPNQDLGDVAEEIDGAYYLPLTAETMVVEATAVVDGVMNVTYRATSFTYP